MIKNSLKVWIAAFLSAASLSYASINGKNVIPNGNNPEGLNGNTLTNIVQNTSDIPEQMSLGSLEDHFRLWYDFSQSGIDFSNTNKNKIIFYDNPKGDRYGVGIFDSNGQGFVDLYINGSSLNNPVNTLTNNSMIRVTVCDSNSVYNLHLNQELKAIPGIDGFSYTNQNLGTRIGGIDTDGDHLLDYAENETYHTNPNISDTDNDGYEDGIETKLKTDPLSNKDRLNIQYLSLTNNNMAIRWYGAKDIRYDILKSSDLSSWEFQDSIIPSDDGLISYNMPISDSKKFLRIKAYVEF